MKCLQTASQILILIIDLSDRHLVSHSRLLSSETSHVSELLLSETGLPVFLFFSVPNSEPIFAKSQVPSFLNPTLYTCSRIRFWLSTKVSPTGLWGGQTECFMSCPWYMWCSGKSHRLQTISGDDCELFSLYPRLAWRGRGQTSACSCRGFLTLSEGMGGQRL